MSTPEFSRRIKLDEVGMTPKMFRVEADPAELAALAERFGLAALEHLSAEISLSREAAGVRARGRTTAALNQICVVSGQPVPASVDEPLDVLFAFAATDGAEEELELDAADCDVLPLEGEGVDLGELAAETMSLALDPYPRLSDDALADYRKLLMSEEEAARQAEAAQANRNPFAVLKKRD